MFRPRFKPVWGILMLVAAGLNAFAASLGGRGMPLVLAGLFSVIGILYLVNPAFVVEGQRLLIKNPLGMTLKTYTFDAMSDFEIEGGKVWLNHGGARVRIRGISRLMVHGDDWRRFEAMVRDDASPPAGEPHLG